MRMLPLLAMFGLAGCESCDFSFGQILLVVEVLPDDREALVELCTEQEGCRTQTVGAGGDTGLLGDGTFDVGHQGYAVCKVPAYSLTVAAEGCETAVLEAAAVPVDRAETTIAVELSCEPI